jgi:hypothetical protein
VRDNPQESAAFVLHNFSPICRLMTRPKHLNPQYPVIFQDPSLAPRCIILSGGCAPISTNRTAPLHDFRGVPSGRLQMLGVRHHTTAQFEHHLQAREYGCSYNYFPGLEESLHVNASSCRLDCDKKHPIAMSKQRNGSCALSQNAPWSEFRFQEK